jgi:hypothetical protein
VVQEECSTQPARPSPFCAAPAHNPRDERGQSALAAARAHFSHFGTGPAPASLPLCPPVPPPNRATSLLLSPPASLRHSRPLKARHRPLVSVKKSEIALTRLISCTSIFLIDKFLPISQFSSSLAAHEPPIVSNRNTKRLEISLTRLISCTSIFLIDKFLRYFETFPICAALCANPPASNLQLARRGGPPASALSNRNTKKLKIALTHRKQSLGQFLIATFRALFHAAAFEINLGSPSVGNQLATLYVLNSACGGCNLPCRP